MSSVIDVLAESAGRLAAARVSECDSELDHDAVVQGGIQGQYLPDPESGLIEHIDKAKGRLVQGAIFLFVRQ